MPNKATAFDLPFYDIFAAQKALLSKIYDVIACGLPPQTKILATPVAVYGLKGYDSSMLLPLPFNKHQLFGKTQKFPEKSLNTP